MNEEWVNQFLEILAEDEGTEGRKVALEGGVGTRGYGITHIADGLKNFLSFNKLYKNCTNTYFIIYFSAHFLCN